MSEYTTSLRNIIRMHEGDRKIIESWFCDYEISDFLNAQQIIILNEAGWSKERLARKIVDHYLMREIAYETIPLFKHFIKVHMQEIMEEKLPLIYSKFIDINPLTNIQISEIMKTKGRLLTAHSGKQHYQRKHHG